MAFAGLKKQINKCNQYMTEKMGGAEGTKLDLEFVDMERKTDVTFELVDEVQIKTKEYLQPNPTARAKMAAVKGISKLSGQAKASTYPQSEGVLGECMVMYGKKLGDDSIFGQALQEFGEGMKQMADVKYSLDDNVKQNFLEPLHHLQTKDLKEVMHHRKKLQGRRLDFDCKRRRQAKVKGSTSPYNSPARSQSGVVVVNVEVDPAPPVTPPVTVPPALLVITEEEPVCVWNFGLVVLSGLLAAIDVFLLPTDDEIRQAEEKFAESLHLAQMGMFNLLENDIEQISQMTSFAEALYEYHQQCTEIMRTVVENLQEKKEEAANRPKVEFVPKTLADLQVEGISESMNGGSVFHIGNSHTFGQERDDPFDPWSTKPARGTSQANSPTHKPNQLELITNAQPRSTNVSPMTSPVKSSPARTPAMRGPCCTALYDFDPENPGELGFKEGDTIALLNKIDENWFEGSVNGRTGYFPISYVQIVTPLP